MFYNTETEICMWPDFLIVTPYIMIIKTKAKTDKNWTRTKIKADVKMSEPWSGCCVIAAQLMENLCKSI